MCRIGRMNWQTQANLNQRHDLQSGVLDSCAGICYLVSNAGLETGINKRVQTPSFWSLSIASGSAVVAGITPPKSVQALNKQ